MLVLSNNFACSCLLKLFCQRASRVGKRESYLVAVHGLEIAINLVSASFELVHYSTWIMVMCRSPYDGFIHEDALVIVVIIKASFIAPVTHHDVFF